MLLQITEGADVAARVIEGRSDTFVIIVVSIVFVGGTLWMWVKKDQRDDERKERLEKEERERMDRRELADRDKNLRDSTTLEIIGESSRKSADGIHLVAGTLDRVERRLGRHDRAFLSMIESADARNHGDEVKAKDSLRDARSILTSGD